MKFLIVILAATILTGCKDIVPSPQKASIKKGKGKILIRDRTGKEWDVTHAVRNYGFKAVEFQFGLGPETIPPLMNPEFLSPGDPDYPDGDNSMVIIGFELNGEARAYPLWTLKFFEVVNDQFDETTFVSPAY